MKTCGRKTGVGPAEQTQRNARAHGDDIDCDFFYRNPHREYRERKALRFENRDTPDLAYVICRCRVEGKEMAITKFPIHFREPPDDTDVFLADIWQRRSFIGQMVF